MKIYLIRHGETKGNLKKKYIGRTDEKLCSEGRIKLENKKDKGYYPSCDVVFSSPMKRCLETADILYPEKKKIIIDDLSEMNFGCFEGKNYDELTQPTDYYLTWVNSNCELPIPGGESKAYFIKRSVRGFEKALSIIKKDYPSANEVSLVVHGGTIMSILSSRMGGDFYDYQVSNGDFLCYTI